MAILPSPLSIVSQHVHVLLGQEGTPVARAFPDSVSPRGSTSKLDNRIGWFQGTGYGQRSPTAPGWANETSGGYGAEFSFHIGAWNERIVIPQGETGQLLKRAAVEDVAQRASRSPRSAQIEYPGLQASTYCLCLICFV